MQNNILSLGAIRSALADRNLSVVAKSTGYTRSYMAAVRSGRVKNPSYKFVETVSRYLQQGYGVSHDQ